MSFHVLFWTILSFSPIRQAAQRQAQVEFDLQAGCIRILLPTNTWHFRVFQAWDSHFRAETVHLHLHFEKPCRVKVSAFFAFWIPQQPCWGHCSCPLRMHSVQELAARLHVPRPVPRPPKPLRKVRPSDWVSGIASLNGRIHDLVISSVARTHPFKKVPVPSCSILFHPVPSWASCDFLLFVKFKRVQPFARGLSELCLSTAPHCLAGQSTCWPWLARRRARHDASWWHLVTKDTLW